MILIDEDSIDSQTSRRPPPPQAQGRHAQQTQHRELPIVQSNAWGMLYGALFTGLIAASQGHTFSFDTSPAYVLSLIYLALFGSVIAFGSYLTLLGRIGAHRAGYCVVMFPVVAIVISVLFEDLQVTPNILLGVLRVLAGNTVILSRGREGSTAHVRPAGGAATAATRD